MFSQVLETGGGCVGTAVPGTQQEPGQLYTEQAELQKKTPVVF